MPNSVIAATKQTIVVDRPMLSSARKTFTSEVTKTTKVSDLVRGLGEAENRFRSKAIATKGIGSPIGEVEYGAGDVDGYYRRFENGNLYMKPPAGPCYVHGSILAKYLALGGESGFLGYPTTDELGTPAGTGRFNHFERGSIYWTYAWGAHEVHGAIRDRWAALGWDQSWLGFPKTDEFAFPEDGRASVFEHGTIYWWQDTGAIDLNNVSLRYKGLHCFGETNDGSAADEPYVVFGTTSAGEETASAVRTQIYESVDAGFGRVDTLELYRGAPIGIALALELWENDEGNPDEHLPQVKDGVKALGKAVAAGCGALFGPEAAPVCEKIWGEISDKIAGIVNGFLGSGDDLVGRWSTGLEAKQMITLSRRTPVYFSGIEYQFESTLLSGDGGSYKVYFDVVPVV